MMDSIYSTEALQRILDHWHVGQIEDVRYLGNPDTNIWFHFIETPQGDFELYSFADSSLAETEKKVLNHLEKRFPEHLDLLRKKEIVHSFDRYHVLLQLRQKHLITAKQVAKDLDVLVGQQVEKAFRVYGSIFDIWLKDENILASYGHWSIQHWKRGRVNLIVDTHLHQGKQLDQAIEVIQHDHPIIERYILKGNWFELYLSNKLSIHFTQTKAFPAIEIQIVNRKNRILIFDEQKIFYSQDLRK